MGGGGGGGGGVLSATLRSGTGGWTIFGMSTNTRKMFRPAPSYLVSSLALRRSKRNVGSRDRTLAGFLALPWTFALLGGASVSGADPATLVATGAAALDEPPPSDPTKRAPSATATTSSTAAKISFVRFSAPSFTTASSSKFPP